MSEPPSYTEQMAVALGLSPSQEAGIAVWNAIPEDKRPPIHKILATVMKALNLPGALACRHFLGEANLSPQEQGDALQAWRRTSSALVRPEAGEERKLIQALLERKLIGPEALVSKVSQREIEIGPLAWMVTHARYEAADTFLELAEPTAEDKAQTLNTCLLKNGGGSPRSDRAWWVTMIIHLMERGADPNIVTKDAGSSTPMSSAPCDNFMSFCSSWKDLDPAIIKKLLGSKVAAWTEEKNGWCPMSHWLSRGGDMAIALDLAQGKPLSSAMFSRILRVVLTAEAEQSGSPDRLAQLLGGALDHAKMDIRDASQLVDELSLLPFKLYGQGKGIDMDNVETWWQRRIPPLVNTVEEQNTDYFKREIEMKGQAVCNAAKMLSLNAQRKNANKESLVADAMKHMKAELEQIGLDHGTPVARGQARAARL